MTDSKDLQAKPVIAQYLERYKGQIAAALPRHMTADRMSRIVLTECRKTPALLECDPRSLFGAVIQASQLGLEPGSALGQCYLLPFNNRAKKTKDVNLIIGYRGMVDLARRSGQVVSIEARAVYAEDEFRFSFGLKPDLHHVPAPLPVAERGELTHVYAVAHLVGGGVQWDVMLRTEVEAIRDNSQGYQAAKRFSRDSPWDSFFEEMAKKTVVRRLFKLLPVSIEIQTAIGVDEQADAGVQNNAAVIEGEFLDLSAEEDAPKDAKPSQTSKVKDKVRKAAEIAGESATEGEAIEGEVVDEAVDAKSFGASLISRLAQMKTNDGIDEVLDLARELPEAIRSDVETLAARRRHELESGE